MIVGYIGNQKQATSTGGGTSGPAEWGQIQGPIEAQADLQAALADKATSAQGLLADTALQPEDVGSVVQSFNESLQEIAEIDPVAGTFVVGTGVAFEGKSGADARDMLGLGTAAIANSGDFATAAQGALADTALQPNYVENTEEITYTDLGILPTIIALDVRKKWNIGFLSGADSNYIINEILPEMGYLEPAHFTLLNNGSVVKTIAFNTNLVSLAGSTLSQVTIPVGSKIDFDVRRNPLNPLYSYEVKVGDVNYNQTASGLATTWNPSTNASNGYNPITETTPSQTFTFQNFLNSSDPLDVPLTYSSVLGFGGKSSGKHQLVVKVLTMPSVATTSNTKFRSGLWMGLVPLSYTPSLRPGVYPATFGFGVDNDDLSGSSSALTQTFSKGISGTVSSLGVTFSAEDTLRILVDFDEKKLWFAKNGQVINEGADPNLGLGSIGTPEETNYFPYIGGLSIYYQTSTTRNPPIARLLNEIEDPYAAIWPSFINWTA